MGIGMTEDHPNIALLKKLRPEDISGAPEIFAEDCVWHYYNLHLPDLNGDYIGHSGLQSFFGKLATMTDGTFKVNPVSISAVGNELVVMQNVNTLTLDGDSIETDVVVVWRIVENKITEVWDIPSIYTRHTTPAPS